MAKKVKASLPNCADEVENRVCFGFAIALFRYGMKASAVEAINLSSHSTRQAPCLASMGEG